MWTALLHHLALAGYYGMYFSRLPVVAFVHQSTSVVIAPHVMSSILSVLNRQCLRDHPFVETVKDFAGGSAFDNG
jgi:hypothetical protein